jgi:hypothetical protein
MLDVGPVIRSLVVSSLVVLLSHRPISAFCFLLSAFLLFPCALSPFPFFHFGASLRSFFVMGGTNAQLPIDQPVW